MLTILAVVGLVLVFVALVLAAMWLMGECGIFGFFAGLSVLDSAGDVLELIFKIISEAMSGEQ